MITVFFSCGDTVVLVTCTLKGLIFDKPVTLKVLGSSEVLGDLETAGTEESSSVTDTFLRGIFFRFLVAVGNFKTPAYSNGLVGVPPPSSSSPPANALDAGRFTADFPPRRLKTEPWRFKQKVNACYKLSIIYIYVSGIAKGFDLTTNTPNRALVNAKTWQYQYYRRYYLVTLHTKSLVSVFSV